MKVGSSAEMQECTDEGALKDVAPTWHSRLVRLKSAAIERKLWHFQMASPKNLTLGEASGFSSSYVNDCAPCVVFSQTFLTALGAARPTPCAKLLGNSYRTRMANTEI